VGGLWSLGVEGDASSESQGYRGHVLVRHELVAVLSIRRPTTNLQKDRVRPNKRTRTLNIYRRERVTRQNGCTTRKCLDETKVTGVLDVAVSL
jgi:hypothetical protein